MINKDEIDAKSAELGVHTSHVQRDYVFGWLLAGLFDSTNPLHNQLVLKGGNAFRKAYFEHARYSNDLDFSSEKELTEDLLRASIRSACDTAQQRSGVEFLPDESRIGIRETAKESERFYEVRVYFKSFYGKEELTLKVELDVTEYDKIFLPVQMRPLIHSYSDLAACVTQLRCQKLEELLASKLKALLQRRHSPDLYDFVYSVFFQKIFDIRRLEVITTFLRKTIYQPSPGIARSLLLGLPFQILRGLWNEYLVCPKPSSITFEDAESSFRTVIDELFGLLTPQPAAAAPAWGGRMSYFLSNDRDLIMEAGRLQRLLQIMYDGLERFVEPYSLAYKRRKDGVAREYFYAWDPSGGRSGRPGIRCYIADKIRCIRVTDQTFQPRYPIELAKTHLTGAYFATPTFQSRRVSTGRSSFVRPITVECVYCGKQFKRSGYDTKLNKHNDRFGTPCYGRAGVIR